jgi:transcriptional regulator with XRE-family HTH domain
VREAPSVTWLRRLQLLFHGGNLSYRELGRRAKMSHTHTTNILTGRAVPSLPMLHSLLNALSTDVIEINSIINQFVREVPDHHERSTQTAHRPGPTQADLHALTAAITELNGLLREFLQEQRRYP